MDLHGTRVTAPRMLGAAILFLGVAVLFYNEISAARRLLLGGALKNSAPPF